MYKKIAVLLSTLVAVPTCAAAFFLDYDPVEFEVSGKVAVMTGVIDSDIQLEIEDLLEENPQVTTIIMRDVEGSVDDEANLRAARYVRENGLNTHIPNDGLVASGGTDFFLAGVQRTAGPNALIGVHSWSGGGHIEATQLPQNHPAHQKYLNYYRAMGIPTEFYWFTLEAAPSDDIHWMTIEEQKFYRITTR
ncbi:MAG: alpha/beta hydrolase [Spirulina sp. SIO3F2]|nr:alpha/beta hydrolase [Spirulina sp. SIO3F2]